MSNDKRPIIDGYSEFLEAAAGREGTPKSLQEAIDRALMIGPLSEVRERTFNQIKDFLAQRFAVAIMNASKDPIREETLMALFKTITKEEAK